MPPTIVSGRGWVTVPAGADLRATLFGLAPFGLRATYPPPGGALMKNTACKVGGFQITVIACD